VDSQRRRALSDFYREEFLRHLHHLQHNGMVTSRSCEAVDRAYQRFATDLERVCAQDRFPAVAESLLERFETLTRLSKLEPRQSH
jgi:hypothetical protein